MRLVGIDPGRVNLGIAANFEADVQPRGADWRKAGFHAVLFPDEKTQVVFTIPTTWCRMRLRVDSANGADVSSAAGFFAAESFDAFLRDADAIAVEQQVLSKFSGNNQKMRDFTSGLHGALSYAGFPKERVIEVNSRSLLTLQRAAIEHTPAFRGLPLLKKYTYAQKKGLSVDTVLRLLAHSPVVPADNAFARADRAKRDDMADALWLALVYAWRHRGPAARRSFNAAARAAKRTGIFTIPDDAVATADTVTAPPRIVAPRASKESLNDESKVGAALTIQVPDTSTPTTAMKPPASTKPAEADALGIKGSSSVTVRHGSSYVEIETFSEASSETKKPWFCYCLASATGRRSYVGATVDPDRRLRQHNGEIKGGAKATHRGRPWRRAFLVSGFRSEKDALSFEWHWKARSRIRRRRTLTMDVLARRGEALDSLLRDERWSGRVSIVDESGKNVSN